jgi:hypothetical protein
MVIIIVCSAPPPAKSERSARLAAAILLWAAESVHRVWAPRAVRRRDYVIIFAQALAADKTPPGSLCNWRAGLDWRCSSDYTPSMPAGRHRRRPDCVLVCSESVSPSRLPALGRPARAIQTRVAGPIHAGPAHGHLGVPSANCNKAAAAARQPLQLGATNSILSTQRQVYRPRAAHRCCCARPERGLCAPAELDDN